MPLTRRELLFSATAAAGMLHSASKRPPLCVFSKHLQNLNYDELGKAVGQIGFNGVDLTVRPRGHVLPERVTEDLPRAVEQIGAHGVSVPMITTALTSGSDPAARRTLSTAGRLKIPYFKIGYTLYRGGDIEKTLAEAKRATESLVALGKEHGIVAGFHNHSGAYVGTAVWDIRDIIADSDPQWVGYYFDACHATAEGGVAGWQVGLRLALSRLKMLAVKDFYWEKRKGRWRMRICPLGQGWVNWPEVFSMLAKAGFTGPVSLHMEYEAPDQLAVTAKDFELLTKLVKDAYGA
jgi:sugar phosphate isomerase/epimerase